MDRPNLPKTTEEATSPEVLKWCEDQIRQGKSYESIRSELGLGPANIDWRWRQLRHYLVAMQLPAGEEESLVGFTAERIDTKDVRIELLEKLRRRLKEKPEDKNFLWCAGLTKQILDSIDKDSIDRHKALLDVKREKSGGKGKVTIVIHSNVPRPDPLPEREVKDDSSDDT